MILCSQCIVSVWYSSRYSGTDYLRHSHISDFFACDNNPILKLLCRWCAMVGSYMDYKIRDLVMKYLTNCIPWIFFLQFFQPVLSQAKNCSCSSGFSSLLECENHQTIWQPHSEIQQLYDLVVKIRRPYTVNKITVLAEFIFFFFLPVIMFVVLNTLIFVFVAAQRQVYLWWLGNILLIAKIL